MSSTNVTVRTDSDVKRECEGIYGALGMSLSTAINVFLRKSIRAGGFPFDVRLDDRPNRETMDALLEADRIAKDPNAKRYHSIKELFADLERDEE
ncbi:type II toxin-antitoxin system RelB/DinJ family antitoxin [Faecousia sp.]|uniref:type II toxin-antitoxin system RelB/DinJ family antitoxin n=1 Tax=Faecousia sp. TaxID=2952921 RepID=UPI003AB235FD